MKAKTVVDVMLGEAVAGDYQDMLGIASVMANRVAQTGKSWKSVISATSRKGRKQFDAYNKALPAGVNRFRAMAVKALNEVMTKGPVHNATFYATPDKTKNLPDHLSQVAQTKGHVYYSDPQNRPIKTTEGAITPMGFAGTEQPAAVSALDKFASAVPSSRPNISVGQPFSPENYAEATAPASAKARAAFDAIAAGQNLAPSMDRFAPSDLGVPSAVDKFGPVQNNSVASFNPTGAVNDIATPAGGYAVAEDTPNTPRSLQASKNYVDPLDTMAAQAFGAEQAATVDLSPPSYEQQMADYQGWQDAKAARMAAKPSTVDTMLAGMDNPVSEMAFAEEAPAAPDAFGAQPSYTPSKLSPGPRGAFAAGPYEDAPALPDPTEVADYASPVPGAMASETVSPTGEFPTAPEISTWDKVKYAGKPVVRDAMVGLKLGGPLGALGVAGVGLLGRHLGLGQLGPGFDNAAPDRFSTGFGLSGIASAMGGPKGAQGFSLSNPGSSFTSLGNGFGLRRSDKFGWTEHVDPSGRVVGIKYDKPETKGLFGRISKSMNDKFGGGISDKERSEFSGKAGLW